MPQLMPLMWMFSSLMVMLVIISACIVYSGSKKNIKIVGLESSGKINKLWFW